MCITLNPATIFCYGKKSVRDYKHGSWNVKSDCFSRYHRKVFRKILPNGFLSENLDDRHNEGRTTSYIHSSHYRSVSQRYEVIFISNTRVWTHESENPGEVIENSASCSSEINIFNLSPVIPIITRASSQSLEIN
jgi:hypothetical protein